MKNSTCKFLVTVSLAFVLIFPSVSAAKKKKSKKIREGTCTEVLDAAHIIVKDGAKTGKIRLLGLDSFDDIVFPTYSRNAQQYLYSIIGNKKVILEYPDGTAKDSKGYIKALVFHNNVLINTNILEEGQAHYYTVSIERYAKRFEEAKKSGKKNERGFWSKSTASTSAQQMNDFMAKQMNSNMGLFMNQNMQQMLPAANKKK